VRHARFERALFLAIDLIRVDLVQEPEKPRRGVALALGVPAVLQALDGAGPAPPPLPISTARFAPSPNFIAKHWTKKP